MISNYFNLFERNRKYYVMMIYTKYWTWTIEHGKENLMVWEISPVQRIADLM